MKTISKRMMMKISGGLMMVLGLLLLAGCFTLSVHPFYEAEDVVFEPGLLGVWGDPEDGVGETWQFLTGDDGAYQLVIRKADNLRIDPDLDGVFVAHVFRLGGQLYLDLFPEEPAVGSEFYFGHVVPAHSVWQMELSGHALVLKALDTDQLQEEIASGRLELGFVERDNVQVLTEESAVLRAMLLAHGSTLFDEGEALQRIQ